MLLPAINQEARKEIIAYFSVNATVPESERTGSLGDANRASQLVEALLVATLGVALFALPGWASLVMTHISQDIMLKKEAQDPMSRLLRVIRFKHE